MSAPSEQEIQNLGKYFAITSNNDFWRLSEKELSKEEQSEILKSAFTSLYHWEQVGNDDNKYLAYLAVARALTLNNVPDLALDYATQTYQFFEKTDQQWISAFINAILSHALFINGDMDKAAHYYQQAQNIGNALEPEDKEIFVATFTLIPEPANS